MCIVEADIQLGRQVGSGNKATIVHARVADMIFRTHTGFLHGYEHYQNEAFGEPQPPFEGWDERELVPTRSATIAGFCFPWYGPPRRVESYDVITRDEHSGIQLLKDVPGELVSIAMTDINFVPVSDADTWVERTAFPHPDASTRTF